MIRQATPHIPKSHPPMSPKADAMDPGLHDALVTGEARISPEQALDLWHRMPLADLGMLAEIGLYVGPEGTDVGLPSGIEILTGVHPLLLVPLLDLTLLVFQIRLEQRDATPFFQHLIRCELDGGYVDVDGTLDATTT